MFVFSWYAQEETIVDERCGCLEDAGVCGVEC